MKFGNIELGKEYFYSLDLKPDVLSVDFDILTLCNYHCPYCRARAVEDMWGKLMPKSMIDRCLEAFRTSNRKLIVNILGGEPTLHPNLNYLIDELQKMDNVIEIQLITNGDKDLSKVNLTDKCYVNISFHPYNSIHEHLLKNLKYLKTLKILGSVVTLMFKPTLENIRINQEFVKKCEDIGWTNFDLLYIFDPKEDDSVPRNLTLPEFKTFKTPTKDRDHYILNGKTMTYHEIFEKDINHFKGWKCYISQIHILVNGNVDASCIENGVPVGQCFKNLNKGYIICPYDECNVDCLLEQVKTR